MRGDKKVLEYLNEQLTAELTAINQYFLHAKMQENWGYNKLAAHTRKESIEEILADEEYHIDYLETQLHLLDTLGEQLYLAGQIEQPATGAGD